MKTIRLLRILLNAGLSKQGIRNANLRYADLRYANLSGANLRGANLRGANLSDANLSDANLSDADLRGANLRGANLSGANLSDANLRGADLRGANLRGANLSDAKISEITFGTTINCPEEGAFIAYKKCQSKVVKILIPEDAKRSSATTYKCRASKVKTLEIEGGLDQISSDHDAEFIYKVEETIEVTDFDENRWNECSTGIHFFMNKEMAKQYN